MIIFWIIMGIIAAIILVAFFRGSGTPTGSAQETPSMGCYENGKKLTTADLKARASKAKAEIQQADDRSAAIEKNVCAKLQRELDSMKVNYLTSFTSMDLYALKDIANYVEFVRGSIKATLDDKQKNDIIWKIKSDKDLSELIRGYETNRKGTNGYIRVEGLIRQAVGS